ncbi:MAG TPA: sarcosine oxidase subunit gamma family protein [Sphingobium sp.]|uniref:sarcosine oxidase subunit gamma family protein n=1 Tax=Sphingobium sp. TaxID=1912891 RepID=UPI002ED485CC
MADDCTLSPLGWRSLWDVTLARGPWRDADEAVLRQPADGRLVFTAASHRRLVIARRDAPGPALGGLPARIADVSDNWRALEITGIGGRELLARGVEIDILPAALPIGDACQTLCAGVPVIVHVLDDATIELFIAASYAPWLARWLAASLWVMTGRAG